MAVAQWVSTPAYTLYFIIAIYVTLLQQTRDETAAPTARRCSAA
jgi:hypothetical protein